jgi:hypothetical protein
VNDEDFSTPKPGPSSPEPEETIRHQGPASPSMLGQSPEERRNHPRFEVSVRVHLTIFAEISGMPGFASGDRSRMKVIREGFSNDLSESGICVVLDDRVTGIPLQQLVGRKVKLHLEWTQPDEDGLKVLGQVAWGREKDDVVRLGIQFTDLSVADRKTLGQLCQHDESELSRISNLWELLVAEPRPPSS